MKGIVILAQITTMNRLLPFLFSFLLISLHLQAQFAERWFQAIDIKHYNFEIQISDSSDMIRGRAEVHVQFSGEADSLFLDLVSSHGGDTGMTVTSVFEEGESVPFRHNGEKLAIKTLQKKSEGDESVFNIRYRGIPADGLIISKNKYGNRTFFGDNWPDRAHHYLPCIDHPSEKSMVDFQIIHPSNYQVVANGYPLGKTETQPGTTTTSWKSPELLPMKVIVFGAAEFAIEESGKLRDIPVSAWVFPENQKDGFYDYAQAVDILAYFDSLIGPYPWLKLANVQSKTRYGGMENASCIFYSENSIDGKRSSEGLIAHEIAHQWFGNSATEKDWQDIWLSEGFATYLTHMYFEDVYGEEIRQTRMKADRNAVAGYRATSGSPVVDPAINNLNRLLNPNSYEKGSWVLHMLRVMIGDEAFREGLRNYYKEYEYGNAATRDFKSSMENTARSYCPDLDLTPFFEQWIFRPGHPVLEAEWNYNSKREVIRIEIKQLQQGEIFYFPLDIGILTNNENEPMEIIQIMIEEKVTEFEELFDEEPVKIVLDPKVNLLFEEARD